MISVATAAMAMSDEQFNQFLQIMKTAADLKQNPTWWEHVDLMQICLVAALFYIVWSLRGFLSRFEKNIEKLFTIADDQQRQLNVLQGEHNERRRMTCGCEIPSRKGDANGEL